MCKASSQLKMSTKNWLILPQLADANNMPIHFAACQSCTCGETEAEKAMVQIGDGHDRASARGLIRASPLRKCARQSKLNCSGLSSFRSAVKSGCALVNTRVAKAGSVIQASRSDSVRYTGMRS